MIYMESLEKSTYRSTSNRRSNALLVTPIPDSMTSVHTSAWPLEDDHAILGKCIVVYVTQGEQYGGFKWS